MKRILIFIAALALSAGSISAAAQGKNEVNVYMGFMNATYTTLERSSSDYGHSDLYSIYEPYYDITSGPSVTVDFNHRLLSWLGVGVQANFSHMSGEKNYRIGNAPAQEFWQNMVAVLPQAKFYIPSTRHFRLYAKVAAGINFNIGETTFGQPVSFAWDIAPIGFEWGGQVIYGTAELCVGNVISGARIGVGYRF